MNCMSVLDHFVGLAVKRSNTPLRCRSQVFVVNFEHNIRHNNQYINHLLLFTTFTKIFTCWFNIGTDPLNKVWDFLLCE